MSELVGHQRCALHRTTFLFLFGSPDDFRMFCGDLGNEVTDETLQRAFGKYPSFVKAKVVRDRRSNKTKGYGFASFRDPLDFTRAMREMNGQSPATSRSPLAHHSLTTVTQSGQSVQ